jgi:hypothetical protein
LAERDYSHRALLDKLGVREGMRVAVIGVDDADFERDLQQRDVARVDGDADVALLGVSRREELADAVADAWSRVAPGGALWIVYPKGVRVVTEHDVRGAGLAAGLVDVKVVRFSATHTGFRFVVRRAGR